jgi:formate dehydrogenase subunit gamma
MATRHTLRCILLLLGTLSLGNMGTAAAADAGGAANAAGADSNPRSPYWRAVRAGVDGTTTVRGTERGELIDNTGENWRALRNGIVASVMPWSIVVSALVIAVFYAWRGRIRLEEPPGDARVARWSLLERTVHWYTALLFIVLALTGCSLLLGRALLIPLVGHAAFATYAELAMRTHNLAGPAFAFGLAAMIVLWARDNIPRAIDLEWFRRAGGMGKGARHAPAGRMNGGEKAWFWFIATAGVAVVASGLVLDFPNLQQRREVMAVANLVHGLGALAWTALALGHIYIGTLGTEGALEGMLGGDVSATWARQHHDHWYAEKVGTDGRAGATPDDRPAGTATRLTPPGDA